MAKYFRKERVIRTPDGDKVFKSINEAKKESRKLQMAEDGCLGKGSLKVVDTLPDLETEQAA